MKHAIALLVLGFFSLSLAAQQSDPLTIKVLPRPSGPVITGLTLICEGAETTLKVTGDYESFLWNTGGTDRFLKVKEAGVYEVTVKTKGGCSITSSVVVRTRPCS
jgi:hypothetical protein